MSRYDDILYLDRPISKNHPQMSIYDRSAQFAPLIASSYPTNAAKGAN